jgi:fructose-1,6-bisphosphatase-3
VNFERGYIILNAKYLDLLAQKYDCEEKVVTEIINLEAILNLPKGTEHLSVIYTGSIKPFNMC